MTAPWQRSWLKSKNKPLIFVRDVLGIVLLAPPRGFEPLFPA